MVEYGISLIYICVFDLLFILLSEQKKKSYMYHWLGCEVVIRGLWPTFCEPYSGLPLIGNFSEDIKYSLDDLKSGEADLAGRS